MFFIALDVAMISIFVFSVDIAFLSKHLQKYHRLFSVNYTDHRT